MTPGGGGGEGGRLPLGTRAQAPPLAYAISPRRAAGCYSVPPARRSVLCHRPLWPWPQPVARKLATTVPDAVLVLMAAAAALAAADPPPAMPQAAGAGGPTARRDFYWLRSFLAGGGCPPRGPGRAGVAGRDPGQIRCLRPQ